MSPALHMNEVPQLTSKVPGPGTQSVLNSSMLCFPAPHNGRPF